MRIPLSFGTLASLLVVALLSFPSARATSAVHALMKQQGCFVCHAVDAKIVGPAYAWVAYHYRGDKTAVLHLADKIIHGGVGVWNPWTGGIPMPPHPNLTLAQAEAMARWVLARKPIAPPKP